MFTFICLGLVFVFSVDYKVQNSQQPSDSKRLRFLTNIHEIHTVGKATSEHIEPVRKSKRVSENNTRFDKQRGKDC